MFSHINVDCCKTLGCKNLGLMDSPDYLRQGNNVLCRECGYLFPVISEQSLNIFRHAVNRTWRGVIKQCPHCGGTTLKKYGFSSSRQPRIYCGLCHRTFILAEQSKTDSRQDRLACLINEGATLAEMRAALALDSTGLNRELAKLSRRANLAEREQIFSAFDITLSTRAFRLRFNGGDNYLYMLATVDEQSGRVIAISSNYCAHPVESAYQYRSSYEERLPPGTLTHLVQRKELITSRRDVLFDVDYGPAMLHKNDPGMVVKPVLSAYRHFELVRLLTDARTLNVQHYLDHECFMYGGCMMANLADVKQGRCHISFVRERGTTPPARDLPPRLFLAGGVRNNVWRTYSTRDYAMAICNLTGNKKIKMQRHATLKGGTAFISWLETHPFVGALNRMSPGNIVAAVDYMKYQYNKAR